MEEFASFSISGRIARATLTREKSLNSLTLDTINLLYENVSAWLQDDDISCIVLDSSSDRAFCAGADITRLYHEIKAGNLDYADAFFANEYRLDHMLHQAEKPILVWGSGVVMGGGLGLFSGCSHRVGTPDNRIAMPEITIGLFPDAGGTWLLSRLPDQLGIFAGMTGCQLSAGDALELGMLDYVLDHEQKAPVLEELSTAEWSGETADNHRILSELLATFTVERDLPANLLAHRGAVRDLVERALASDDFFAVFESGLTDLRNEDWLATAADTYAKGSPTTARVFLEQLGRAKEMSLADTFRMELAIACQCARRADFPEGVRALLVDKDRNPAWSYVKTGDVPESHVAAHFSPSWEDTHPLSDLG